MKVKEPFSKSDYPKKKSLIRLFLLCKYPSLMLYLKYNSSRKSLWCNVWCSLPPLKSALWLVTAKVLALRPAFTQLRRLAARMHMSLSALVLTPARAGGSERLPKSRVVSRCRAAAAAAPLLLLLLLFFPLSCVTGLAAEFNTSDTMILQASA